MNENVSAFDPELFQNTTQEAEFSTDEIPVPEGEYNAAVAAVKIRQGGESVMLDLFWKVDSPGIEDADGRMSKQTIFLDINDGGQLDFGKGKNVQLGRLLAALNLNGKPWTPQGLKGYTARVKVTQRAGKDDYEGRIFDEIKSIVAL